MGFEQIVQSYVTNVSALMLKNLDRVKNARKQIQAGTYKADQIAADAAQTWIDGLDTVWSLMPYVGSPVVPTILLMAPAKAPVGTQVVGAAYLAAPVPDPMIMAVSDLAELGGATKHAKTIALKANGFQLEVTFTVPAKLTAGAYQAIVFMGSAPLALIILNVT